MQKRKLKRTLRRHLKVSKGGAIKVRNLFSRGGSRGDGTKGYGLGPSRLKFLFEELGLQSQLVSKLRKFKANQFYLRFGELRKASSSAIGIAKKALTYIPAKSDSHRAIENLVKLGAYRGLRLAKGYPVRGQRTRSNAKTSAKLLHLPPSKTSKGKTAGAYSNKKPTQNKGGKAGPRP